MAFLTSYSAVGNREHLDDIIKNISPTETPLYSMAGKETAENTNVEWLDEELRDPKENAGVEGADYVAEEGQEPERKNNYTQIVTQTYGVTKTEQAVKKAGVKNLFARRMRNGMKECATDVEYAIINNKAKVSGTASVARKMGGLPALITTNILGNSGTGRPISEDLLNDALQLTWAAGGTPNKVVVSGKNKRNISGFTGSATKNIDAKDKRLVASVDVYESDFGLVAILGHRQMSNDDIFTIQTDMTDMATLRSFKKEKLKVNGDRTEGNITGELTLIYRAEKSGAIITDLNGDAE